MSVTIGGKEPVTKDDVRKLELFVLAGVEVCAALINTSLLST